MKKTISPIEARDKLGQILDQAYWRGDEFIIVRRGKPLAVLVPFEEYQKWLRDREGSFKIFEKFREANKDFPSEEIEKDIAQAIREVREKKRLRLKSRAKR